MSNFINNSKRFLIRNSSTILTCVGAIGVVATAVMSAKDTIKASKIIKEHEEPGVKLSKKEIVRLAAPAYIPTIAVGLSTVACVFGANVLNKRAQASLMSAYALLDGSFKEYRKNVKETYGENADKEIKESIAKNHYDDSSEFKRENGKQLFIDLHGLQFFNSTIEEVENAEKAVNQLLEKDGYVSLSTFYEMLGIKCADIDYEVGWSSNMCSQLGYDNIEFIHDNFKAEDGSEFIAITMSVEPIEDFMWF